MDRQTETLKTAKHIFCAPIPLVLMRLNADSVNGNSRFKTFLNYMSICLGGVKIVYKKDSVGVGSLCRSKYGFDKGYSSVMSAKSCNSIVIPVKIGHNNSFVDNVPKSYLTLESTHLTSNSVKLLLHNFLIAVL